MFATMSLRDGRTTEYVDLGDPSDRSAPPVFFFHGTPGTGGLVSVVADAARNAHVRVIAVSRPGYGDSTPSDPGLMPVAYDALELADHLGVHRFAAVGVSGGGPFALALAVAAPERVTTVAVHGGVGAYYEVSPVDEDDEEQRAVKLWTEGDRDGALAAMTAVAEAEFGPLRELSEEDFARVMDEQKPEDGGWLDRHPPALEAFLEDFRRAIATSDGYVRDTLSWGGRWDVDLSVVASPVRLVYGESDGMVPMGHGEWLRERLPSSELLVIAGGHGDVTFGAVADSFALIAAG
jgi:pimeloyl-ACP methyl ester carboxylesterase